MSDLSQSAVELIDRITPAVAAHRREVVDPSRPTARTYLVPAWMAGMAAADRPTVLRCGVRVPRRTDREIACWLVRRWQAAGGRPDAGSATSVGLEELLRSARRAA